MHKFDAEIKFFNTQLFLFVHLFGCFRYNAIVGEKTKTYLCAMNCSRRTI